MFIKRLYRHSKVLFFAFVLFLFAFVFLNLKWGVVATPVYQYGMFSGVMKMNDTTLVYSFYANDTLINLVNVPFPQRDKIMVGIQRYTTHETVNAAIYSVMKRILTPAGMGSLMEEEKYIMNASDSDFTNWLEKHIQKATSLPVDSLNVYSTLYKWQGKDMIQIGQPLKLRFIGAER